MLSPLVLRVLLPLLPADPAAQALALDESGSSWEEQRDDNCRPDPLEWAGEAADKVDAWVAALPEDAPKVRCS